VQKETNIRKKARYRKDTRSFGKGRKEDGSCKEKKGRVRKKNWLMESVRNKELERICHNTVT